MRWIPRCKAPEATDNRHLSKREKRVEGLYRKQTEGVCFREFRFQLVEATLFDPLHRKYAQIRNLAVVVDKDPGIEQHENAQEQLWIV